MFDHHHDGRSPPAYTPEELSWLTGIPEGLPPEIEAEDRTSLFSIGGRRGRLDAWLDRTMDRLIAMRDALDATTEDMEDDDPAGRAADDEGEHILGWTEQESRTGRIGISPSSDDREDDDPAEEGDAKEDDDPDRCPAGDDNLPTFRPGWTHPLRPRVSA